MSSYFGNNRSCRSCNSEFQADSSICHNCGSNNVVQVTPRRVPSEPGPLSSRPDEPPPEQEPEDVPEDNLLRENSAEHQLGRPWFFQESAAARLGLQSSSRRLPPFWTSTQPTALNERAARGRPSSRRDEPPPEAEWANLPSPFLPGHSANCRRARAWFYEENSARRLGLQSSSGRAPPLRKSAVPTVLSERAAQRLASVASTMDRYIPSLSRRNYALPVGTAPPLTEAQIDQLLEVEATEEDEGLRCIVCQELLKRGDVCLKLKCGHMFHEECLKKWLVIQGTCPLCRDTVLEGRGQSRSPRPMWSPPDMSEFPMPPADWF